MVVCMQCLLQHLLRGLLFRRSPQAAVLQAQVPSRVHRPLVSVVDRLFSSGCMPDMQRSPPELKALAPACKLQAVTTETTVMEVWAKRSVVGQEVCDWPGSELQCILKSLSRSFLYR